MRWVYPRAPKLHDAVFFQLRRNLIQWRQRLRDHQTHPLPLTLLRPQPRLEHGRRPLVSIIVPCYNHSQFLAERLASIRDQTYQDWELILLDDASTDKSLEILRTFQTEHPHLDIRLIDNSKNSGSPFRQWKLGLEHAQGDLVWIAESDDSCDLDFIEKLVPFFNDEAVRLAFCRTRFCSSDGMQVVWELESYIPELGADAWKQSWTASTYQLVQRIWSRRNLIPNVSATIFRRPRSLPLLNQESWQSMRVCGDWLFYLNLARSGRISYASSTTCYYRQHNHNTSGTQQREQWFFDEHVNVCKQIQNLYKLNSAARSSLKRELEQRWTEINSTAMPKDAKEALNTALQENPDRKPEVMLGTYALVAGGGELAPLRLANLLKQNGYGVSVLNAAQMTTEPMIRARLHPDIPLFNLESLTELEALIRDQGVEILHTHHSWLDLTAAELLSNRDEVSLVVTSHGLYDAMSQEQLDRIASRLTPKVAEFTVVADKNQKALQTMNVRSEQITIVGNALDEGNVEAMNRSELGISEQAFVACLVSRAIREKGWEVAIKALAQAREQTNRDLQLLLVGSGPEVARLKKKYTQSWVHFLGFQSNSTSWFACADIGLLPTEFNSESRPFTLLECLRAGRPYLASALGEIPKMLQGEREQAGKAIPLKDGKADCDAFAEAIIDYVLRPELLQRHQQEAAHAAKSYNGSSIVRSYEMVYKSAITRAQNKRKPHLEK